MPIDSPILTNLISNLIWSFLVWISKGILELFYKDRIKKKINIYPYEVYILFLASLWIAGNIFYSYFTFPYPEFFVFSTFIIFVVFLIKEIKSFSQAGLLRLDTQVAKGMDYDKALQLCTNELAFLGIGASKLTKSAEFIEAVKRCNRPNEPIRFLLTKPNNSLLEQAGKQQGVDSKEYSNNVKKSLDVLKELKTKRQINIEVRFYPMQDARDFPIFRLMFIDDSLCLLSYNVFGEGDGSQLPQLHLKNFQNRRNVESFYYPFKEYFDNMWKDSSPWDFKFPIT